MLWRGQSSRAPTLPRPSPPPSPRHAPGYVWKANSHSQDGAAPTAAAQQARTAAVQRFFADLSPGGSGQQSAQQGGSPAKPTTGGDAWQGRGKPHKLAD